MVWWLIGRCCGDLRVADCQFQEIDDLIGNTVFTGAVPMSVITSISISGGPPGTVASPGLLPDGVLFKDLWNLQLDDCREVRMHEIVCVYSCGIFLKIILLIDRSGRAQSVRVSHNRPLVFRVT